MKEEEQNQPTETNSEAKPKKGWVDDSDPRAALEDVMAGMTEEEYKPPAENLPKHFNVLVDLNFLSVPAVTAHDAESKIRDFLKTFHQYKIAVIQLFGMEVPEK
jgi:hypothetical protein